MVLAYCKRCSFHELTRISGEEYSKCCKENCLSIYAKCLMDVALRQFICRNELGSIDRSTSALDICYPSI